MEEFVLTILKESNIYAAAEIHKVQSVLEQLQSQRDVEKEKYKADSLQNSKEYQSAILVYESIINKDWDESVDKKFYGVYMRAWEQHMVMSFCIKKLQKLIRKRIRYVNSLIY